MGGPLKDGELDKIVDKAYDRLKSGYYRPKLSDHVFSCPFCVEKRGWEYTYNDLMYHARGRSSASRSRYLKERGHHIALASYLKKYHCPSSRLESLGKNKEPHVQPAAAAADFAPSEAIKSPADYRVDVYHATKNNRISCKGFEGARLESFGMKESHVQPAADFVPREAFKSPADYRVDDYYATKNERSSCKESEGARLESFGKKESHVQPAASADIAPERKKLEGDHEKFVFPWKGIVVNVPLQFKDGRYVGPSGNRLKDDQLKDFNPSKVTPLWSHRGHSGSCIVDFPGDWAGFEKAMKFEKHFESDHCGKKDWYKCGTRKYNLHGWVAREDDYYSGGLIGKHLQKFDLKSTFDIEAEESRKTSSLLAQLNSSLQNKDEECKKTKSKLEATSLSMNSVMQEKDKMIQDYNEEWSRMIKAQRENTQRLFAEHDRTRQEIESKEKKLELLSLRVAQSEDERRKLYSQKNKNKLASAEQKKADENMLRLAEEHKQEKEKLHKKILDLEKELDHKQVLELEIERLKGAMNVVKHMGNEEEMKKKMESVEEDLKEKEEELDAIEQLSQTLIIKEQKTTEQLREGLDALINGLKGGSTRGIPASIGVRKMGELNGKPFEIAVKRKYPGDGSVSERATELWSSWEAYLRDSNWQPYKEMSENGRTKVVIDEEDVRLKKLKEEMGEEVYEAVVKALLELKEYNPEGRNPVLVLWNNKEDRQAKLKEGVAYLVKQWRMHKLRKH